MNGFRFQTLQRGTSRFSNNSGVCVKGTNYTIDETDYYGQLQEVVELEYLGWPIKRTVLFKCEWFDITPNVGTRIHKQYKLVDVNHTRRYAQDEPFVLAMQAQQVYYCTYLSLKRDTRSWWAVCKIKARGMIEMPAEPEITPQDPFQEETNDVDEFSLPVENDTILLNDPIGEMLDIDVTETLSHDDDDEEEYDEDEEEEWNDLNSDEN